MKLAIIDMGTNTFHLLVIQINDDGTYEKLYKSKLSVKLGEDGITKGFISHLPFKRALKAMMRFKHTAHHFSVEQTYAFATAAIRNASNGKELIQNIFENTGIEPQIISGDEEAEFIYHGVKQALDLGLKKSLIMDIGGGSIEFIIADQQNIYWKRSIDMGAAILLEKFNPSNPITMNEIQQIETYSTKLFQPVLEAVHQHGINTLIGSSGSFDTLAELEIQHFHSENVLKGKTEFTFNFEHCKVIHEMLLKSTVKERSKMAGMLKMRIDMIVLASILVNLVKQKCSIQIMRLSTYSLKEGVLFHILQAYRDSNNNKAEVSYSL